MTTRDKWAKHVAAWRASEMTARDYAASAGINAGTLQHWAWKLKREDDSTAPTFVEVAFREAPTIEVTVGDATVRVPAGVDRATLAVVLHALRSGA